MVYILSKSCCTASLWWGDATGRNEGKMLGVHFKSIYSPQGHPRLEVYSNCLLKQTGSYIEQQQYRKDIESDDDQWQRHRFILQMRKQW